MDNLTNPATEQPMTGSPAGESTIPAPRWIKVCFKIYAVLIILLTLFSFSFGSLQSLAMSPPGTSLSLLYFILLAVPIFPAVIIGIGSWKLRRWVIPLFGVSALNTFSVWLYAIYLSIHSPASTAGLMAFTLPVVIVGLLPLGVAYVFRKSFSGSYVNYIAQGLYLAVLIFQNIPK